MKARITRLETLTLSQAVWGWDAYDNPELVDDRMTPLIAAPWVELGGVAQGQLVTLDTGQYRKPHYPVNPGTISILAQLSGQTMVRPGRMRQRKHDRKLLNPGEALMVIGDGKRSFENPGVEPSLGLLVEVLPRQPVDVDQVVSLVSEAYGEQRLTTPE